MRPRARHGDRISNFAAGVLALVLVVGGTYIGFNRGLPFGGKYEVHAVVATASELHSRTPVRIAGVEVGKVAGYKRLPGGRALITLQIEERGRPLHADATLKVRPRIFLEGNFFVELRPGTPGSPELAENGVIPITQTAVPVQLDEILSAVDTPTRESLLHLVDGLAKAFDHGGAEALRRSLPHWEPVFRDGSQAAEAMRGLAAHDLSDAVRHSAVTAAAIAGEEHALPPLVTGLNRSLRALASRRERVSQSVRELAGLVREARPALEAVDAAIPSTRGLVNDLRPALRDAAPTLRLALPLLDQVDGLLGPRELPAALAQLEPAVRSLIRTEAGLGELLKLLHPVVECARLNAVPTLKKTVPDPPITTGIPIYRELLHGIAGLSSGSQNFDANGPAVRYHAGFGDRVVSTGRAPSSGEALVGLTSEEILGSRPMPVPAPPFRPDVPCGQNEPPNLDARTGPAPQQRQVGR